MSNEAQSPSYFGQACASRFKFTFYLILKWNGFCPSAGKPHRAEELLQESYLRAMNDYLYSSFYLENESGVLKSTSVEKT